MAFRKLLLCPLLLLTFLLVASPASAASILLYDDNTNLDNSQAALGSLGLTYTTAGAANFNTLLASMSWDLVIMDVPSNIPIGGFVGLMAYVAGGGRAILSYWDLDADLALQAAFGVGVNASLSAPANVHPWTAHPIFSSPNSISPLTSFVNSWGDDGDRFTLTGPAAILAGFVPPAFTPNQGAIGLFNGNRTLVNGFLFDEITDTNGINLIANEISFLVAPTQVPEPATLSLIGLGLAMAARRLRRRP